MALQTKTISDTASKGHHKFILKVVENSTSTSGNTSSVTFTFTLDNVASGYDWAYSNTVPVTWSVSIAGKSYSGNIMSYDGSGVKTLKSATISVPHNSDGSKSISYSFSVSTKVSASYLPGSASNSGSMTLTKIPRKATITSAPNFNDEANPTISYSNKAGSAVSGLKACIASSGGTILVAYRDISKTKTSYTFNLTTTERDALRDYLNNAKSGTVRFYVKTTIGDNNYTDYVSKTLSIINANPTFASSNISYKDTASAVTAITGNAAMIVQNKSNLQASCTAATAKKKATISKYEFWLSNNTKDIRSKTSAGSVDFGKINSTSNITLYIKATDSRGNSTTISKTVTCYPYYAPSLSITPYRSDSVGTKTDGGQYAWCDYKASFASVNGKNKVTIKLYTPPSTTTTTIVSDSTETSGTGKADLGADNGDNTYKVYAKITDSFGGSGTSSTYTLYGTQKILNIYRDGTGVAIGKKSSGSNLFECKWPAVFDGSISGTAGVNTSSDRRIKKNIKNTDLNIVHKLQPVEYQLIDDEAGRVHYGFIAQDIVKILTEAGIDPVQSGLIGTVPNKDFEQLTLSYTEFIPLLVNDNQRLQQELTDMRNELKELKQLILKGRD